MKKMKKICICIVICMLFSMSLSANAEQISTTSVNEESVVDESGTSDMKNTGLEDDDENNVETSEQNTLYIDDKNKYQGMCCAYNDGYEPEISGNTVSVILPLCTKDDSGASIRVTPSLVESANSPFEIKNYQKTFDKSSQKINDTESRQEVYLVSFSFALKKERYNGVYPIKLNVEYNFGTGNTSQEFVVYVQITDGKDENQSETVETVEEKQPESEPKIIIKECKNIPDLIAAGEDFSMTAVLENTDTSRAVKNMTVTVNSEGSGVTLIDTTNVYFVGKISAGETAELPLSFHTSDSTVTGDYSIVLGMSYDDMDAVTLTSEGKVTVHITQKPELEMEVGNIPEQVMAGDSFSIPIQAMNLSKGRAYNVRCNVEVPGLITDNSLFIGDLDGGTAGNGELETTVDMVNPSGETEADRYGETSGKIVLYYEDEDGNTYSVEQEVILTIQPPKISGDMVSEDTAQVIGRQLRVGIIIIAAIVVGGSLLICGVIRKRKKEKRETE